MPCGGCGGRSTTVRVARNVPKNKLKNLSNGVIVMRQNVGKKARRPKSKVPAGGVRVVRNKRR